MPWMYSTYGEEYAILIATVATPEPVSMEQLAGARHLPYVSSKSGLIVVLRSSQNCFLTTLIGSLSLHMTSGGLGNLPHRRARLRCTVHSPPRGSVVTLNQVLSVDSRSSLTITSRANPCPWHSNATHFERKSYSLIAKNGASFTPLSVHTTGAKHKRSHHSDTQSSLTKSSRQNSRFWQPSTTHFERKSYSLMAKNVAIFTPRG